MKNYIAGGRSEIENLAFEAYETQPPLFREYLAATPEVRAIMDNQFKNIKTNARLLSKSGWHAWRAQLLADLMAGLKQSGRELDSDHEVLKEDETLLDSVLPALEEKATDLQVQHQILQQRAAEYKSADREELEAARERLAALEANIHAKSQTLSNLEQQVQATDSHIEMLRDRKEECEAEVVEADRVREECRGWSSVEVASAKATLDAVEAEHGWVVTGAASDPESLTLCYQNDLELFFNPSAFDLGDDESNAPISLSYIGDKSQHKPRELTMSKRFFLQLLRAHIHGVSQATTSISSLFTRISQGWATALAVSEAVRRLEQVALVEEVILADEKLAIDAMIVLPSVQTKVRARFAIAALSTAGRDDAFFEMDTKVEAKVVYGERYKEETISKFLSQFISEAGLEQSKTGEWATGTEQLKKRLRTLATTSGKVVSELES